MHVFSVYYFYVNKIQSYAELKSAIESKQFTLGVVGLGYVGLPLVFEFVSSGISVVGLDANQEKINQLQRGESYIQDISMIKELRNASTLFTPTTDFSELTRVDVISICVPTPSKNQRP